MTKILAISGSLRRISSNKTLLIAADRLAPTGMEVLLYEGIGQLPHFNPDFEDPEPPTVTEFKTRIKRADGLLISSPEYAHGVPGALKNALDWLVGGIECEIVGKPTALWNASPGADFARDSLIETLRTMGAFLVPEAYATVNLRGKNKTVEEVVRDKEISDILKGNLAAFLKAIEEHRIQTQ